MGRAFGLALVVGLVCGRMGLAQDAVEVWMRYEKGFESDRAYENPLYDVREFSIRFISPTGRAKKINGFWDGGRHWRVRFCPDEKGTWTFQTSCSDAQNTVDWITKGPMAANWARLPARPLINMEPCYEGIGARITDRDVRNASYWSILATPPAGITYGASGIWPWLRQGEQILNHGRSSDVPTWDTCIDLPGSIQIGYLADFMRKLPWWRLKPAQDLLAEQPGDKTYNHFISVARTDDSDMLVAYIPVKSTIRLHNPSGDRYQGQWFDPVTNEYSKAVVMSRDGGIELTPPQDGDMVLVLNRQ